MTPREFLKTAYQRGWYKERSNILSWYFTVNKDSDKTKEGYVSKDKGSWFVRMDGEEVELSKVTRDSYLDFKDGITFNIGDLPNIGDDIDTTAGLALANMLVLCYPFKDKIPYINNQFDASYVEELIVNVGVTVDEYNLYIEAMRLLMGISGLIVYSATPRNVTPAKGIEKFKKSLLKKYDLKDPIQQADFVKELQDYDSDWLKDDPSNGIVMSGKTKNRARLKLYGSFAIETSFDDSNTSFYPSSQNEGMPTDKESLAELHSSLRAASYSRGHLTQHGGVLASLLASITEDVVVLDKDCGTTRGVPTRINPAIKSLIGMHYLDNNKTMQITQETLTTHAGKILTIRSPVHCIEPDLNFCRKCVGETFYLNTTSARLASQEVSSQVTTGYLKIMHGIDTSSVEIPLEHIIDEE